MSARPSFIHHKFPVRPGVLATLILPDDITDREAERLGVFLGTVAVDDDDAAADLPVPGEPPACDDCGEHHEGYGDCPALPEETPDA